jgi:hypothetical protein
LIKTIYIANTDTVANTITVTMNDNGTLRVIVKVTLQVGDTWSTDGTTDTNGNLKTIIGSVNLANVTGTLGVINGGTGAVSLTGYVYGNGTSAMTASTTVPTTALSGTVTNAQLANSSLTVNGTAISLGGSGTVTAAAGTLTGTTLNSTVVTSSLTSVGTIGTGVWNGTTIAIANGGTGQTSASAAFNALSPITTTGDLILGNGTNSATRLAIGANTYVLTSNGTTASWVAPTSGVSLSANNTWTGTQTFNGTSSIFGTVLLDSAETVNVIASAPSSTTNFYIQSGSVQYYTSNAANNWTLNIAFSSGTSLNTALTTGQSVTFTLVTTQGSTAYYNSAVTIDGTSVTPKWIGGAPTAGNASGFDVYRFAVIKTASATYSVLASLTQYK